MSRAGPFFRPAFYTSSSPASSVRAARPLPASFKFSPSWTPTRNVFPPALPFLMGPILLEPSFLFVSPDNEPASLHPWFIRDLVTLSPAAVVHPRFLPINVQNFLKPGASYMVLPPLPLRSASLIFWRVKPGMQTHSVAVFSLFCGFLLHQSPPSCLSHFSSRFIIYVEEEQYPFRAAASLILPWRESRAHLVWVFLRPGSIVLTRLPLVSWFSPLSCPPPC